MTVKLAPDALSRINPKTRQQFPMLMTSFVRSMLGAKPRVPDWLALTPDKLSRSSTRQKQ